MTSIQAFLAQSKISSRKESIPPAIYLSKVKKVILDTRYKDDAIIITYRGRAERIMYPHRSDTMGDFSVYRILLRGCPSLFFCFFRTALNPCPSFLNTPPPDSTKLRGSRAKIA